MQQSANRSSKTRSAIVGDELSNDIVLVGHISRDLETSDINGPYRIGGTVSFAAVVAVNLGRRPVIVTSTETTTDLSELPPETLLYNLPAPQSTTFANIYSPHGRVQYCYTKALPIGIDDIPLDMRSPSAVLLGPLIAEVMPDVASVFNHETLVGAIPQGWMRSVDEDGRVHSKPWENYKEILPHLDVLVLSLEDIDSDLSRLEPLFELVPLLIMTEYHDGSTVYRKRSDGTLEVIKIPPRPAIELDPTGAGDVFTSAFMIRYQETGDPIESARFANIAASYSVESVGVSGVPTRETIEAYMTDHPFEPEIGAKRIG